MRLDPLRSRSLLFPSCVRGLFPCTHFLSRLFRSHHRQRAKHLRLTGGDPRRRKRDSDISWPSVPGAASRPLTGRRRAAGRPALDDVGAVYITYDPDLAVPGATEAFCAQAMKQVFAGSFCCPDEERKRHSAPSKR